MNVKKLIKETYAMQQQSKELNDKIQENKKKIQQCFDNQEKLVKDNSIIVDNIKVTKVRSAYITYNGYKLEEKLRKNNKKKLTNQIIKKSYSIVNIKAFTDLIKLTNISPYELKKHLFIERQVNSDVVKRLFEKGELAKEDLEDCMNTKIVDSIRFAEINTSEGD